MIACLYYRSPDGAAGAELRQTKFTLMHNSVSCQNDMTCFFARHTDLNMHHVNNQQTSLRLALGAGVRLCLLSNLPAGPTLWPK